MRLLALLNLNTGKCSHLQSPKAWRDWKLEMILRRKCHKRDTSWNERSWWLIFISLLKFRLKSNTIVFDSFPFLLEMTMECRNKETKISIIDCLCDGYNCMKPFMKLVWKLSICINSNRLFRNRYQFPDANHSN